MSRLAIAFAIFLMVPQVVAAEEKTEGRGEDPAGGQAAAIADPAHLLGPPPPVVRLVMELARLQDASARGEAPPTDLQRRLLIDISRQLRSADPLQLPEPRVLRAAIIYVLSGGRPGDADPLVRATPQTDPLRWLLNGAMAFARGQKEEALKSFQPFAPERLPGSIAGRIALARAMSLPETETAERVRLLRLAARLMPGTLVEESALRRLGAIAERLSEPSAFEEISNRYVRRYGRSIYAQPFFDAYGAAVVGFEARAAPVNRQSIEISLSHLERPQRMAIYISMARIAALHGLTDLTLFSASRARRLADPASAGWHIATLYDAAVQLIGPDYDTAIELLRLVDADRLDLADRDMLAATLRLAGRMRQPATAESGGDGTTKKIKLADHQVALFGRAERELTAAEDMLKGSEQ